MTTTIERPNFRERCSREGTRDVIFLLQEAHYIHYEAPSCPDTGDAAEWDDDGGWRHFTEDRCLTNEELVDLECAVKQWRTISVWLSREEATAFAEQTHYRYPDGWRVYGVCANGELAELLKTT